MALTAGQINVGNYPQPDYSGVVRSAQSAAAQGAEGISKAVGQVTDYFKQQGDKKKLIKQSDSQIDAALKLFPELSPALQGIRDRMRDENISLDERAMLATNSQDSITNALNIMKTKTTIELARERENRMTAQTVGNGATDQAEESFY